MAIGLSKIRQIKIPVTELQRSVDFYRSLLDLELVGEFTEEGVVRGALLMEPDKEFVLALRDRSVCADQPSHVGFDLFALEVGERAGLDELAERCDRLGYQRTLVFDLGEFGSGLDITDPDGTLVRFLWNNIYKPGRFLGMETDAEGGRSFYDSPRLR